MRNYSCLLCVLLFVEVVSGDETIGMKVTTGDSVTLPGFPELKGHNQILWMFNNSIIVKVEEAAGINETSTDQKFRDILKWDKDGSLTIIKTESIHAGIYQLKISGNEDTKHKRFSVTVHAQSGAPSGICGAGVGLVVWAVAVFLLQEV